MSNDTATPPPSPRQVLLGLFVLGQLTFLVVANLFGFVKWLPTEVPENAKQRLNQVLPKFGDRAGHGWEWLDEIGTGVRRYVQLTGQDQDWALFAPHVGMATEFPAVLFRWDAATPDDATIASSRFTFDPKNGFGMQLGVDGPRSVILRSENEPADVRSFFRCSKCRWRRYEGQFWISPQPSAGDGPADCAKRVTQRVQEMAKEYHDPLVAYLRWRLQAWQHAHADEPTPRQVILLVRFYRIHDPDEEFGWDGPTVFPVVRWLPMVDRSAHAYMLEAFDFTDKQFVRLK